MANLKLDFDFDKACRQVKPVTIFVPGYAYFEGDDLIFFKDGCQHRITFFNISYEMKINVINEIDKNGCIEVQINKALV